MTLLTAVDGTGLAATVGRIQRRAFCHFADQYERAEQLPSPEIGCVSVIGTRFDFWDGVKWMPLTPSVLIPDVSSKADKSTTIATTAPLAGGGDLSADRTLSVAAASLTAPGVVELATAAEATAQTDATRAVTPAGLVDRVLTSRSIATTAPLTGGGNLSADRTLDISTFTATVKGAVPAPTTASGTKYLRDDGTWQTPTTASADAAAQGVLSRTFKSAQEGGFGSTEFAIATFSGVVANAAASRWTTVRYGLEFYTVTQPAGQAYYIVRLRAGAGTGGTVLELGIFPWTPNQQAFGAGYTAHRGSFGARTFAAAATVSLTMQAFGGLVFGIGTGSVLEMVDEGAV